MAIKLFIIDQQPLFRQGVHQSLSSMPDIEVCGEASVGKEVLPTIDISPPDVVLIDIDAPSLSGLELARIIKGRLPSIATVILTPKPDDEQLFQSIKARAAAYIPRDVTAEELTSTIRRVAAGEHPINENMTANPRVAEKVLDNFQELTWGEQVETLLSPLTHRETEILNYIAQGYLNKQIAAELHISEQTIKNHVTSILRKLDANARTQAVIIAIKRGLISLSED